MVESIFFHFLPEMGFLACITLTPIEIICRSSQEFLHSPQGTASPPHLLWRSGLAASGPAPTSLTLKLLASFQSSLARSGVRREMTIPEQKRERMVSVVLPASFPQCKGSKRFPLGFVLHPECVIEGLLCRDAKEERVESCGIDYSVGLRCN